MDFPIIDLVAEPDVPARIDAACREIGFFAIVGHGVPTPVIGHAWSAATRFFDLDLEEKLALQSVRADYPYGYTPMSGEALASSAGKQATPDLNESFSLSPPPRPSAAAGGGFALDGRVFPTRPGDFEVAWTKYYNHLEALAHRIMAHMAEALGLDRGFFDDKIDHHLSALRALNYPPQSFTPAPGQIRAGAHSDYGSITILLPGSATGGLEVLTGNDEWLAVPDVPEGFIVNVGDLMAMWTNDRWRSTVHRVVNPKESVAASERRQSIAFFHQPNWDALVECLPTCVGPGNPARYPPVRSGPWLQAKVAAARHEA